MTSGTSGERAGLGWDCGMTVCNKLPGETDAYLGWKSGWWGRDAGEGSSVGVRQRQTVPGCLAPPICLP